MQPLRAYTGRFRAIPERLTGWAWVGYLFVSLHYVTLHSPRLCTLGYSLMDGLG
ncbi:hypothetical protein [Escherichia phage K1E]|uniref:Uncharacterized protein n=1 Tax=Escherichia phage K1E TaxID=344022 RepID=A0A2I4Q1Z2_BPK1E|nr:hypothetical protein [Escherichia phage K1E]